MLAGDCTQNDAQEQTGRSLRHIGLETGNDWSPSMIQAQLRSQRQCRQPQNRQVINSPATDFLHK